MHIKNAPAAEADAFADGIACRAAYAASFAKALAKNGTGAVLLVSASEPAHHTLECRAYREMSVVS